MDESGKKSSGKKATRSKTPPARTPEEQEKRMINLSMNQAEQMLSEGRAPAQIVVHFLKLATEKARYENEKLKAETEMARAKAEALEAQKHYEEIAEKAINAFKAYGGGSDIFGSQSYDEEDFYD